MPFNMGLLSKLLLPFLLLAARTTAGQATSGVTNAPALTENTALDVLSSALKDTRPEYGIRVRMILGQQKQISGHYEEPLRQFTAADQLAEQHALYNEICEAKIKIGEIIYDHGNYDSALVYFLLAQKIAESHALQSARSYALYYIGKYNETKGNFKEASEYYDTALAICRAD